MAENFDVVICGGGVTGCSTAYFLASNPDFDGTVLVIERDPTYENAPSAKATGGIRQQFSTAENIQIGLFGAHFAKNADEYLSVDGDSAGIVFREQGYLLLGDAKAMPVLKENQVVQQAEGANISILDAKTLKERFPWVDSDELEGAAFGETDEGWIDPYSLLQAFKRKARSLGVEFRKDVVTSIEAEGGKATGVVVEDGTRIGAGHVLNSAGASGGRALLTPLGVDVPIESRRRTTFVWECKTDVTKAPLTVLPSGVAWRPEGKLCLSNLAPPAEKDPERFDYDIDYNQFEEDIWPELARYIPAFEAIKLINAWVCHYDYNTLDENAIIDFVPGFENLLLALGFSGHGMQQSPAVGRALSELIVHGEYRAMNLKRLGYERVINGDPIRENNCW